jgi:hypothetical protein
MKHRRALVVCMVVLPALVVVGFAAAGWRGPFADVAPATKRFKDVDKAIAAGYSFRLPDVKGNTCIEEPGVGGMGVHQVNTTLLDGAIDAMQPEVLVYEPKGEKLKLVAVEYVVFVGDWRGASPPALFGRTFDFTGRPNRYDLPAFYSLHAWIFKKNPTGLVKPWNPRVSCSRADEDDGDDD